MITTGKRSKHIIAYEDHSLKTPPERLPVRTAWLSAKELKRKFFKLFF
jgi:hypothetical protein